LAVEALRVPESLRLGGQSQMPRLNAIVAAKNFFEDGFGTWLELRKFRPLTG
jgi:hypothetical protein